MDLDELIFGLFTDFLDELNISLYQKCLRLPKSVSAFKDKLYSGTGVVQVGLGTYKLNCSQRAIPYDKTQRAIPYNKTQRPVLYDKTQRAIPCDPAIVPDRYVCAWLYSNNKKKHSVET